jgi:glutaredoxin
MGDIKKINDKLEVYNFMKERELVLLTGKDCPECVVWKRELKKRGYGFRELNLFKGGNECLEFQKKYSIYPRSVPVLMVLRNGNRETIFSHTAKIKEILRFLK